MFRWNSVARCALAASLACTVALPAQAQSFRVARTFSLSGSSESAFPVQAVLMDVGSPAGPTDGLLDVVAIQQNQEAARLMSRGDGTFSAGSGRIELNDIPTAVGTGDFDGDGLDDIVVAGTSKILQWFRGTDGSLALTGSPLSLAGSPVGMAVGELNDDAHLDVVVINDDGAGGTVQVLLGNGDGSFSVFGEPFFAGVGVSSVVIADFTGDGAADVAVSSAVNNTVRLLRNSGTGFLQVPGTDFSVGIEPVGMGVSDVNGDGRPDLVVVNRSSDSVSVLTATDGGFTAAVDYASGGFGSYPTAVATGDFDKDGAEDIFVANNRSSDLAILHGDGIGGFGRLRAFNTEQEPVGVLVADLNGDGTADGISLNVGQSTPNAAVVLTRADGKIVAIENVVLDPNPAALASGDVDGDGLPDLLVAHDPASSSGNGHIQIYRSQAGGGLQPLLSLPITNPKTVARGDVNGDGVLDIIAVNEAPTSVLAFLGRSGGGFDASVSVPTGAAPAALVVGDWNGDGRDDVATARVVPADSGLDPTGAVEVRLSTGTGFGPATTLNVAAHVSGIAYGDFNEDGVLDLIVASTSGASSALLLGNGNGSFTPSGVALNTIANALAVVVADFDGDRHDDIAILAGGSDRKAVVIFGAGDLSFPLRREVRLGSSPSGLAARDLSGDGIPDLLIADQADNVIGVARSLGSERNFRNPTSLLVSRLPTTVHGADIDGDGRYDAVGLTTFVSSVAILSNEVTTTTRRGDGNGDGIVSAADSVALALDLGDNPTRRAEDVGGGTYVAAAGLDANGDGSADRLDVRAIVYRVFNEL